MKRRTESGEMVVEASIVVTIVVVFVAVFVYLGMILYQRTMLSVVANQTAENIAEVYSNNIKDPFTGFLDEDELYQSVTYNNIKNDAYIEVVEQKATTLAKYRLESYRILGNGEDPEVEVQLVRKPNEILKSQIVVSIKDAYELPFVGFFNAIGLFDMSVTGRADCVDILEYINGSEAVGDPEHSNITELPNVDKCTVTFVVGKDNPSPVATVTLLGGNTIAGSTRFTRAVMPADPTWGSRRFAGWETSSGVKFTATTAVNSDITVYGTWQYKVTLYPEGGTLNGKQDQVEMYVTAGGRGSFPNPSRAGYAFAGWHTGKNGRGSRYLSNDTTVTSDVSLYAHWNCTHDYTAKLINAGTCKQRSTWKYTCVRCPHSYNSQGAYGPCKQGKTAIVNPSCVSQGSKVARCTVCSKVMVNERTPALGHDLKSYSKAATCTAQGFTGKKCSRCSYKEGRTLALVAHDFDARCGRTHALKSGYQYFMGTHNRSAGYTWTTHGECLLCINCGAPHSGWSRQDTNGTWVSGGMICRKHYDNSGHVGCGAWYNLKVIPVH